MRPEDVVRAFWSAMADNDFTAASGWLTDDFQGDWPQSCELVRGPEAFAAINAAYPATGTWRFDLVQLVAEGAQVVTYVGITDGAISARAITFHTVLGDRIARQREYWPDPYDAPPWRRAWVEIVPDHDALG
ncbi:MAG: nuclear transport factor 2 family protein [Pseudomonadota bacterium]